MQTRRFHLEQRSRSFTVTLLLAAALLNIDTAAGRPDVRQSPFSLDLQPPLAEATPTDFERSIDSYGNPIDALRPIDTPDGRKVISAQGVQFEIPNYASGITEIRKPADDLLPPHIDPTKTTTAAVQVDPNPFDSSTLPPWLRDFDYPDVGPGVPYNPDNFKDTGDISGQKAGGSKPNDFQPHGFAINPTTRSQSTTTQPPQTPPPPSTTATPTTTTAASADNDNSAFPSKVTLTLPGNIDGTELNTAEPPLMLIPPSAVLVDNENQPKLQPTSFNSRSGTSNQQTTTNSITHFPERFDTPSSSSSAPGQDVAQQPNQQQFPPFNTNPVSQPDSQKVEYSKSDDGKVISTPVNTQRKDTQGSTSAFLPTPTTSQPPTPPPAASNTGKYTGGFGAPPGLLRPQSASKPDIYVAGDEHEFSNNVNKINRGQQRPAAQGAGSNVGRYTGGFGAPSGVLSPQNAPRPFQQAQQAQPQPTRSQAYPQLAAAASSQVKNQSNRFGGPPGILVPFDNVQRTGGQ